MKLLISLEDQIIDYIVQERYVPEKNNDKIRFFFSELQECHDFFQFFFIILFQYPKCTSKYLLGNFKIYTFLLPMNLMENPQPFEKPGENSNSLKLR